MNKQQYKEYLSSAKWATLKYKLALTYAKQGWSIDCGYCKTEDNLHVHHYSYDNIGDEKIEDERIWELGFLCKSCHYKWHFEKGWKEEKGSAEMKDLFTNIK